MHKPIRWAVGMLLVLGFAPWRLQAAPHIQTWESSNGTRVYFVAAPDLPIVDLRVVFDAGSARDDTKPGLAQLTNELLARGAAGVTADRIASGFAEVGAQFSSSISRDMAWVSLRSLTEPKSLTPVVDLLRNVVQRPDFAPADFERERDRMLIAVRQSQESPDDIADRAFYAAVYGRHPYATPPDGTDEGLRAITREDVVAFHKRYYVARNAMIAIVGDLDRAGAERLAERVVKDLPQGTPAPALPSVEPLHEARTIHIPHPSTQTTVYIGQPGMARTDPDYFALYVGNHPLGGNGLVSELSKEIREKRGLSYSVYSYFLPLERKGPFEMGLQTRNQQTAEAVRLMQSTLQEYVKGGPTSEQLVAAKRNITGGFPLRIDSNANILEYLAVIGFYHLPLNYLDTFNARVEAVSAEQIRDAFQRRVHPDRMVTVTVGGS